MTTLAITRFRGDTVPDEFTIKKPDGTAQDITGFAFVLTVNSVKNPPDDTTQILQSIGTITDATNGVVEFPISTPQADQEPGKYYFDVEATTPTGKKHTILSGAYRFKQDVTKT